MAGLELLSDQGFRIDGRRPHELRKIECRLGVFRQADGSAYIEQGNTKVLAAVYGPHEVRGRRGKALHDKVVINCQYSMATFSTGERKRRPRGDRKSQEMTMHLQQTFNAAILTTLYPRSQIDIFVEDLFETTSIVDFNHFEESFGGAEVIVATLPRSDQIIFLEMNGRLHEDHLTAVMDRAIAGCKDVYHIVDRVVREHVSERSAAIGSEINNG
ncbi:hypothetical protein C0Q70_17644 [Pomacea canaliculata]|uniref:Exoribonuclease phosphorolytic domain-containing protein n=1 Tax=Pomacea canaliculata TaxID=400727 RepID=A0A2T7NL02_POMCA|nr:hypothetical protein C0Q70_17644 [Pomacea canaliculata]